MLQSQVLARLRPTLQSWRPIQASPPPPPPSPSPSPSTPDSVHFAETGRTRQSAMLIENLRNIVLAPPANCERFHAVFLDQGRAFLGVSGFGAGQLAGLSLSLRELFAHGLSLDARNVIIAHNHPSGDCRPSDHDIKATQRLADVAQALEIGLVDHLIFADRGVYSMRAGGEI